MYLLKLIYEVLKGLRETHVNPVGTYAILDGVVMKKGQNGKNCQKWQFLGLSHHV